MGIADAAIDEHGYVMATIPATTTKTDVPVIGFIAHVDTSPEMSGADVKPIVHRDYDGRDLVLPDDPTAVLRVADSPVPRRVPRPRHRHRVGHDAARRRQQGGVAEIMTAAEYLMAHPEIPHGAIRIGFTPDEEVGRGTTHFDVARFGARYAYTMDGGPRGELEFESFSADAITVTFHGFNTHPGYAKGRMVNAIKLAARFIDRLPPDRLSPETTDGREGFVHPYVVQAGVDRTTVKLIVRDFDTAGLQEKEAWLERWPQRGRGRRARRRGRGRRSRSSTATCARCSTSTRSWSSARARRSAAPGSTRARAGHPRRHRRLAAVVHGPADAEPLRRRAELPLAPRVGVGAGHGEGGGGDRRARAGLGGAGDGRLIANRWRAHA